MNFALKNLKNNINSWTNYSVIVRSAGVPRSNEKLQENEL